VVIKSIKDPARIILMVRIMEGTHYQEALYNRNSLYTRCGNDSKHSCV